MTDPLAFAPAHALSEDAEKPPLPENLRPFVADAMARLWEKPPNPGVRMRRRDPGRWSAEAPFADHDAWEALIADAFGTRSHSMVWTFLEQLRGVVGEYFDGKEWRPDEHALTAALNMVATAKPKTEVEAALVVQMVAIHTMMMRLASRALEFDSLNERDIQLSVKLGRTYAQQAEALAKLQGKVKLQEIRVTYERHEHRHFHDERHVHLQEGGGAEIGSQPEAPIRVGSGRLSTETHAGGAALLGPDPQRDALPGGGGEGTDTLPDARVRERRGRTAG